MVSIAQGDSPGSAVVKGAGPGTGRVGSFMRPGFSKDKIPLAGEGATSEGSSAGRGEDREELHQQKVKRLLSRIASMDSCSSKGEGGEEGGTRAPLGQQSLGRVSFAVRTSGSDLLRSSSSFQSAFLQKEVGRTRVSFAVRALGLLRYLSLFQFGLHQKEVSRTRRGDRVAAFAPTLAPVLLFCSVTRGAHASEECLLCTWQA